MSAHLQKGITAIWFCVFGLFQHYLPPERGSLNLESAEVVSRDIRLLILLKKARVPRPRQAERPRLEGPASETRPKRWNLLHFVFAARRTPFVSLDCAATLPSTWAGTKSIPQYQERQPPGKFKGLTFYRLLQQCLWRRLIES